MAGKKSIMTYFVMVALIVAVSAFLAVSMTPALKYLYPLTHEDLIEKYSAEYKLDKYLVMGIISTESGFDEDAKSHKEARGLMQLKDETALWCIEEFGLEINPEDIYTPKANIQIGCAYMQYLSERYKGNTLTAIAAYNAGPGNVDKWLCERRYTKDGNELTSIPFSETAAYVKKVQKRAKIYDKLYGE